MKTKNTLLTLTTALFLLASCSSKGTSSSIIESNEQTIESSEKIVESSEENIISSETSSEIESSKDELVETTEEDGIQTFLDIMYHEGVSFDNEGDFGLSQVIGVSYPENGKTELLVDYKTSKSTDEDNPENHIQFLEGQMTGNLYYSLSKLSVFQNVTTQMDYYIFDDETSEEISVSSVSNSKMWSEIYDNDGSPIYADYIAEEEGGVTTYTYDTYYSGCDFYGDNALAIKLKSTLGTAETFYESYLNRNSTKVSVFDNYIGGTKNINLYFSTNEAKTSLTAKVEIEYKDYICSEQGAESSGVYEYVNINGKKVCEIEIKDYVIQSFNYIYDLSYGEYDYRDGLSNVTFKSWNYEYEQYTYKFCEDFEGYENRPTNVNWTKAD